MSRYRRAAFSLAEVVIALGICAFVLVALMGLFVTGVKSGRESEEQIKAANLASLILAERLAAPTNSAPNLAIPLAALTNAFADVYGGSDRYLDHNGRLTNDSAALYRIVCKAGTNAISGPTMSQLYIMLTWPPQAKPENANGKYETLTYIPLR